MKVAQHEVLGSKLHHHAQSRRDDRTPPPHASAETPTNSTPNAPPNSNASSAKPSPKSTPALRNLSTFVIPSAARNPYHLQTRYPVPQVPPRAFRRYPGENLSALPRKGTAPKFGHVRQGHGFSRAKKPRPKVAASLPQADVAVLTTHDSQLTTIKRMPPVSRTGGMGTIRDRCCVTTHTARRAKHASPARQCWVQNRGEAPSSLPQADVVAHDSQLTTHNKFFSLISRY
jgi:hypothetical protein